MAAARWHPEHARHVWERHGQPLCLMLACCRRSMRSSSSSRASCGYSLVAIVSPLTRAIQTAWLIMSEMDCVWLPIHKTWRLNERMYGALTGVSKRATKEQFGDEQFKKWRRGYSTRPPKTGTFSKNYPGNDPRYVENIVDLPISLSQTLMRSYDMGRFRIHRKLL